MLLQLTVKLVVFGRVEKGYPLAILLVFDHVRPKEVLLQRHTYGANQVFLLLPILANNAHHLLSLCIS